MRWTNEEIRKQHKAFILDHYQSWTDAAKMTAKLSGLELKDVLNALKEERET
tara:strand:+ start:334 stop:489 length:156 start_codon:yes stop_codon:yes gene_type:complete